MPVNAIFTCHHTHLYIFLSKNNTQTFSAAMWTMKGCCVTSDWCSDQRGNGKNNKNTGTDKHTNESLHYTTVCSVRNLPLKPWKHFGKECQPKELKVKLKGHRNWAARSCGVAAAAKMTTGWLEITQTEAERDRCSTWKKNCGKTRTRRADCSSSLR